MASILLTARTSAPPKVVFDILTDSAGWSEWTPVPSSARTTDGRDHRDGVGSIRKIGVGPVGLREEVITFEPDRGLYEYTMITPGPIKDYVGRAEITEDGAGSHIRWTVSYRPALAIPGASAVLGAGIKLVIGDLLKRLTQEAEKVAA